MTVADGVLTVLAVIALVPIAVLAMETGASLLPARRQTSPLQSPVSAVILIPAHDEEAGIARTLRAVLPQLGAQDRVLVVADNCADRTAAAARAIGAEVVERTDPARRGKGYALAFGLERLQAHPPEIVVVLDADCELAAGALDCLKSEVVRTGDPVQALYLLSTRADGDRHRGRLSRFAFLYKNLVRPLGLHRLGLPCLLTGTGMAFPWNVIRQVDLGTGNIVEDMKLGVDLALLGHCPRFCPEARVQADPPPSDGAAAAQRTRWEHGHVQTLLSQAPRLAWGALIQGRPGLLALALELAVPPLSLLLFAWLAVLTAAVAWWQLAAGSAWPASLLGGAGVVLTLAIVAAWARHGRAVLPLQSLLAVPLYVAWKVPIYARLVRRPERTWVRTDRRTGPDPPVGPAVQTEVPA